MWKVYGQIAFSSGELKEVLNIMKRYYKIDYRTYVSYVVEYCSGGDNVYRCKKCYSQWTAVVVIYLSSMREGEKDAYGWPSNHSRSLRLPKIYAACVLPGHWTTMLVRNYLWSLTPWTLMARYLHTYASSLSCGGFTAIKVQSTLPKVFGTLKIVGEALFNC